MVRCTYCGRKIWSWQKRAPDEGGYIHSEAFGCKWHKSCDETMARMDAYIERRFFGNKFSHN